MVWDILKKSSFFRLRPSYNFQCSTEFRETVLLPSSGKGKHVTWWTPYKELRQQTNHKGKNISSVIYTLYFLCWSVLVLTELF